MVLSTAGTGRDDEGNNGSLRCISVSSQVCSEGFNKESHLRPQVNFFLYSTDYYLYTIEPPRHHWHAVQPPQPLPPCENNDGNGNVRGRVQWMPEAQNADAF